MKKIAQTMMIGLGLTVMTLMSASAHFTPQNVIRQRVLPEVVGAPEIVLHIYTNEDSGAEPALAPVGERGSIFELWVDVEGEPLSKVDTKWIGQGGPSVDIVVDTFGDLWNSESITMTNGREVKHINRRTRVDAGYVMTTRALNLSSNATFPRSLREVMINYSYLNPIGDQDSAARFTFDKGINHSNYSSLASGVLTTGTFPEVFAGPASSEDNFSGERSKMARKEMVSVDSFADQAIPETWTLGRTIVTTWPLTTASIKQLGASGAEEEFATGQIFTDTIRKIIVTWDSVYPGSIIYANIKKVDGGQESILEISRQEAPYDVNEPQEQLTSTQLNDATMRPYFNKWGNGTYSIEIISANLPFTNVDSIVDGKELLAEVRFTIKRDISVKGNLGTIGTDDN